MQSTILKAQQQVKLLSGNGAWDQLAAQKDVVAAQTAYDAAAASLKQTAAAHNAGGRPDRRPDGVRLGRVAAHQRASQTRSDPCRRHQCRPDHRPERASIRPSPALANAQAKLDQTLQGATDADASRPIPPSRRRRPTSIRRRPSSTAWAWPRRRTCRPRARRRPAPRPACRPPRPSWRSCRPARRKPISKRRAAASPPPRRRWPPSRATPEPSDLALQQEAVHQAELAVQQAQIDLDSNTLVAPFDGVVATITGNPGETRHRGHDRLHHPGRSDASARRRHGRRDRRGQGRRRQVRQHHLRRAARVDRSAARSSPIAPTGTLTQGVVSYPVVDQHRQPQPGAARRTDRLGDDHHRREERRAGDSELRAVRRQGRDQVVEVMGEDGKPATRTVKTGVQNDS